jgi:hypothetical protein
VISTAVAFAPAFAQQTKPLDQTGQATVQPAQDHKTPAADQSGKDEKSLPSKPGNTTQVPHSSTAKTGTDVKATTSSPSAKPAADVTKDKSSPAKPGSDVKTEAVPSKPAADVMTGSTASKTDAGVKEKKSTDVKPQGNLKNDKSDKSGTQSKAVEKPKHHAKKSPAKPVHMMHAKAHVPNTDNARTTDKGAATLPSTGK